MYVLSLTYYQDYIKHSVYGDPYALIRVQILQTCWSKLKPLSAQILGTFISVV